MRKSEISAIRAGNYSWKWQNLRRQFDHAQSQIEEAKQAVRPNIANRGLNPATFSENQSSWSRDSLSLVKWVVIGVPDDRGVVNNYGRPGAAQGTDAFRSFFYRHPIASQAPAPGSILDLGDLKVDDSLGKTLNNLADAMACVYSLLPGVRVLVVGGGHDVAYGEIFGSLVHSSQSGETEPHHIINLDAHADIRRLERRRIITSGTPFYLLLRSRHHLLPTGSNYHPFGLQRTANSQKLVNRMRRLGVDSYWLEDMPTLDLQIAAFKLLLEKIEPNLWHFNIDLDGFPFDVAPGVSAPQPFGLHPNLLLALKKGDSALRNLMSLGIYELSPPHDEGGKTARLAAKIAYYIMSLTEGKRVIGSLA